MHYNAIASLLLALSILPPSLTAKGVTVRITIHGPGLTVPFQSRSPKLEDFRIWSGPGVSINGVEQNQGFIMDWSRAVSNPPPGLRHYEVDFYTRYPNEPESPERLSYSLSYACDPSSRQGYVYLPGPTDTRYRLNTASIFRGRGREGNWFLAIPDWDAFIRPLLTALFQQG